MTYGSVCSGIEAATVAWEPLGWRAAWFSEIDAFPSAVLATRHPSVPNLGDMTRLHEHEDFRRSAIDLLVGGTPCQSFSVAGLRKGLADPRGNLALVFLALADRARPRWLVWENVPGVLSSNGGRDFGAFLGGLAELGYGFAYRVLDAQYFGLAQRRKRVFVVGYLGDWRRAAAVLFERASLSGNPAPRREARKGVAGALTGSSGGSDENDARDGRLIARCLNAGGTGRLDGESETFVPVLAAGAHGSNGCGVGREGGPSFALDSTGAMAIAVFDPNQITSPDNRSQPTIGLSHALPARENAPIAFDARQSDVITYGDKACPLDTDGHSQAISFRSDAGRDGVARTASRDAEGRERLRDPGFNVYEEIAPTLDASAPHGVGTRRSVRRLTPRECERLQGFPDDYTLISYRGKPAADGPRYKAIGNSMAVTCMAWIGRRIQLVEVPA